MKIKIIFLLFLTITFFKVYADIGTEYPNLASGILIYAKLKKNLPENILLQAEALSVTISKADKDAAIKKSPPETPSCHNRSNFPSRYSVNRFLTSA